MAAFNLNLELTNNEKKIFDLLLDVVKTKAPDVTLRTAGGWVRDKLLGKNSQDIDIAVDKMSGQAFAYLVFEYMKENNIPIDHRMAVVKSNPDKSKHLETTILPILGIPIELCSAKKRNL